MAIFLVRHGETPSNAARVVQTADTPLSARGIAQAERLARRVAGEHIERILSSDLPRALMTAACLRSATGAGIEPEALLQERNFGAIRGTPYAELEVDLFAPGLRPPGGESWEAFHARVDAAWRRVAALAAETPGSLAVVTHGLVCTSLALRVLSLPEGQAPPLHFRNSALTVIDPAPPWRVRILNCTAHLEEASHGERSGSDVP